MISQKIFIAMHGSVQPGRYLFRCLVVLIAAAGLIACSPQKSAGTKALDASATSTHQSAQTEQKPDAMTCSEQDPSCKYPRDLFGRLPSTMSSLLAMFARSGAKVPSWLSNGYEMQLARLDVRGGPATVAVVCENHYCFNAVGVYLSNNNVVGGFYRDNLDKTGIWFGDLRDPEKAAICDRVRDCNQQFRLRSVGFDPDKSDDTIEFLNQNAEDIVLTFELDCPRGQSATLLNVLRRAAHQGFSENAYILTTVDSRGDEVRIYHQAIRRRDGPMSDPQMVMSIDAFGELHLYGISREAVLLQCLFDKRV